MEKYADLAAACESKAIEWVPLDPARDGPGARFTGAPIVIRFSRTIPDLEQFTDELLAAQERREPD